MIPAVRGWGGSAAALGVKRAVRVDIEVDLVDAALGLGMAVAGVPGPVTELSVGDFGEEEAFPVATWRQFGAALAGKLESENLLLSFLVTKDNRTEFARIAVVQTEDLFPLPDCLFEQLVSRAGHGSSHHSR